MSEQGTKFRLSVNALKGKCVADLVEGQEFFLDGLKTPSNFCGGSYNVLFPAIMAMRFGAKLPFAEDDGSVLITCPDKGAVEFRLELLKGSE